MTPGGLAALSLILITLFSSVACGGSRTTAGQIALSDSPPESVVAVADLPSPPAARLRPLTGLPADEEDSSALRRPIAVMVDNIVDATPQTGLDNADVVIEALVEGGITRLMAIYQSRDAEVIEPVRSARTPFLQWVQEYDAIYAHVGSSTIDGPANAGQQIKDWLIADIDFDEEAGRWSSSTPFARDHLRKAPHNVITSTDGLRREGAARGYEGDTVIEPWQYQPEASLTLSGAPAPAFAVYFGAGSRFSATWEWEPETGTYLRSQFGRPHVDALTGSQLAFANVVVQFAAAEVVTSKGHVLIDTIGEGRALAFRSGEVIEAVWSKPDRTSRTRFYSLGGSELSLVPGATWIEVVDVSGDVRFP
jgi:hypothetical protein